MEKEYEFWIVAKLDFPTNITYKHTSYESACNEAKRLARKDHEDTFVVMKSLKGYKFNDLVEMEFVDPEDDPCAPF
jgi:hypothetical protein